MSNQKQKKHRSILYNGFGGIDKTFGHSGKLLADDIINFRILKDGSLEKRYGYRLLTDMGKTIRALHTCTVNGVFTIYVLIEDQVYTVNKATGEKILLGSIDSTTGDALFFNYRGELFIADGLAIYRYVDGAFTRVHGYVPLFGKGWKSNSRGEILEPRNILNRHARINYIIDSSSYIYLSTRYSVESVDAVYLNGNLLDSSAYSLDTKFNTINITGAKEGDSIDLYLSFEQDLYQLKERLFGSRCYSLLGGSANNRILLCGKEGSGTVFCSKHVTSESLAESLREYPESDCLYFPEGDEFEVGDGANGCLSMARHQEKVLVFTEGDVWMTTASSEELSATSVSAVARCSSIGSAISIGNGTVSMDDSSVWLWTNDSDAVGNCKATKISEPIDDKLRIAGLENFGLFFDDTENELWVFSKSEGTSWIYNFNLNAWYKFQSIYAENMFKIEDRVAFTHDRYIFVYDKDRAYDTDELGKTSYISAYYTTVITDFDSEKKKNLYSALLKADLDGGSAILYFQGDGTTEEAFTFYDDMHDHSVIGKRLSSARFTHAFFQIQCFGGARQRIHSLQINTR